MSVVGTNDDRPRPLAAAFAMDRSEISRRRDAVLSDAAHLVGTTDIGIRVVDADRDVLVIARVADNSARPGVLHIVQRHFPGAAVKFES